MQSAPSHSFWKTHTGAVGLCSALLLLIAGMDHVTGTEISFSIFYVIPVVLFTRFSGRSQGLAFALLSALVWYFVDTILGNHEFSSASVPIWNASVRFGFFAIIAWTFASLDQKVESLQTRTNEVLAAYKALDTTRKEQLELRDKLLSNVSHELRTPLTAIQQFISLISDGLAGPLTPEQKEYLTVAARNVVQLNRMIADLLDSTRLAEGKMTLDLTSCDLGAILSDTLQTWSLNARQRGITLTMNLATSLPPIRVDTVRIRQVLANLLDNSFKFTPAGGKVTVVAGLAPGQAGLVRVSVMDTGCGIARDAQKSLFQRLSQPTARSESSRSGLGLGLFISREILLRHGGDITVESEPGHGATFHVTLPVWNTSKETVA